ncbi:MAG TPA: PP2C family protein-serine/threonine phosphatase [Gaiellales bacterium]
MPPDALRPQTTRHESRAPLPRLLRRGWLGPQWRIAVALAGVVAAASFALLLRWEGDPTSWKGAVGGVEAVIAMTAGLLAGRYLGMAVGLVGGLLFLWVIGYHEPPDPVLYGVPLLVIWGFAGFFAGYVAERLSESTGVVYAAVADEADTQGRIARALQRALLPEQLPQLPMAEMATVFRPAGQGDELGGDFYDTWLLPLRPGSFAFTVGDVQGKGAEAAAVTALARHTIRTASILEAGPADALGVLNEGLLRRTSRDRFVTAVLATATPSEEGLVLEIASGGHPLPLVRHADGTVSEVGEPGSLLGVWWDNERPEREVVLRHGEVLLAYSDGATDVAGPDGRFGDERLREVLSRAAPRPDDVVGALHDALAAFVEGLPDDDIALLALAPRRADA